MEKRLRTAVIYRDILLVPGFYFYFRQYLQADSRLSKALGFFLILLILQLPLIFKGEVGAGWFATIFFKNHPAFRFIGALIEIVIAYLIAFTLIKIE